MQVGGRIVVTGLAAIVAALVVVSAFATVPGANGRIAFTRYTDATREEGSIYTILPDGTGERRVTRPPAGVVDFQPDWSPDGTRIAFERQFPDKPDETWTVKPDGTDLRQVDPGCPREFPRAEICAESVPAWSPDGRRLAFAWAYPKEKVVRGELWIEVSGIAVMSLDGSSVRQLTQLKRPTSSGDSEPVWSPDGRQIAFVRQNSTARPFLGHAVFVVNAEGSGVRRVTPWSLDAGDYPDWSPNGTRILFRAPRSALAASNLYTVRRDGTGLKQVTRFPSRTEVLSASYSPDGRWIVFSRTGRAGLPDLFVIRPNGTGLRQLTRTNAWESASEWGPK